jgi:hypothetical protein
VDPENDNEMTPDPDLDAALNISHLPQRTAWRAYVKAQLGDFVVSLLYRALAIALAALADKTHRQDALVLCAPTVSAELPGQGHPQILHRASELRDH